jgi:allantoicase
MRIGWKFEIDFSPLKGCHNALPHAIVVGDTIHHCGNFPQECSLKSICDALSIKAKPVMNKEYGIKQDQLDKLEELLGKELGLTATD